ncbi:MAG: FAD-binding oxidoreductase [Oleiphilus sp.]|nr:MAG: FAD-binding oxidoreductase [Oleiphilus sp.]
MNSEKLTALDGPISNWSAEQLLPLLGKILPESCILHEAEDLGPFECDGLSAYKAPPMLVVLPDTKAQVIDLVKLCAQHEIPLVPRGAGTGLSGGAMAVSGGIMVSLTRLNKIKAIEPELRRAVVEPGVRNLAISEAVRPHGLYYAPDPSSQIACSIGGNVAENAGGVHCLKYGLTVNNVQSVECILPDGSLVTIGGPCLDAPGFDLLALIHGSEGMLALVTEIVVNLLPIPPVTRTLLVSYDSVEKAAAAVGQVIGAGIIPAGMEMMDKLAIQAAEDFAHAGYPREAEAILICELDGEKEDVGAAYDQLVEVLEVSGATDIRTAQNAEEQRKFWLGRKSAFPAVGRLAPDYYCMDGTIPKRNLPKVLAGIAALSQQYGLPVANVFHAGDGNLHPLILFDANRVGELEKAEALGGKILELCVTLEGTITGEHGVGREKINQMCLQFNRAEIEQFHATKRAFDPKRIFNPNKNIPTLARCAEFGAMHVHAGEIPFPHLERF